MPRKTIPSQMLQTGMQILNPTLAHNKALDLHKEYYVTGIVVSYGVSRVDVSTLDGSHQTVITYQFDQVAYIYQDEGMEDARKHVLRCMINEATYEQLKFALVSLGGTDIMDSLDAIKLSETQSILNRRSILKNKLQVKT